MPSNSFVIFYKQGRAKSPGSTPYTRTRGVIIYASTRIFYIFQTACTPPLPRKLDVCNTNCSKSSLSSRVDQLIVHEIRRLQAAVCSRLSSPQPRRCTTASLRGGLHLAFPRVSARRRPITDTSGAAGIAGRSRSRSWTDARGSGGVACPPLRLQRKMDLKRQWRGREDYHLVLSRKGSTGLTEV